jgi:hypothetical protein
LDWLNDEEKVQCGIGESGLAEFEMIWSGVHFIFIKFIFKLKLFSIIILLLAYQSNQFILTLQISMLRNNQNKNIYLLKDGIKRICKPSKDINCGSQNLNHSHGHKYQSQEKINDRQ